MLTRNDPARPGVAYRADRLAAERDSLARRLEWAQRRRQADKAARLERQAARFLALRPEAGRPGGAHAD